MGLELYGNINTIEGQGVFALLILDDIGGKESDYDYVIGSYFFYIWHLSMLESEHVVIHTHGITVC